MAGRVSYIKWKKSSGRRFMTVLSSALLEWLLLLMLLINGILAFMITWFARYCELSIPCLLCSRLDHVLGSERTGFYWDWMCRSHKSEISSLVLCTLHEKLVDVHGMCEYCLFSFATKDKSNSETYRLLVGKLGTYPNNDIDASPLLDNQKPLCSRTKICCCCNEPWTSRSHAQALLHTKSSQLKGADVDAPLSREFRLNWNTSKEEKRRPNISATSSAIHDRFEDSSPHFGYSELKLNSDAESEDQMCDDEDSKGTIGETYHFQKDLAVDSLQTEPLVTKREEITTLEKHRMVDASSRASNLIDHEQSLSDTTIEKQIVPDALVLESPNLINHTQFLSDLIKSNDATSEKPIILDASAPEPPNLIDHELSHSNLIESREAPSTLSAPVGHGLEQLNWQDIDLKTESSPLSDLNSINDVPESPNAVDIPVDPPKVDYADSYQNEIEGPLEVEPKREPENIERIYEAEKEQATSGVLDSKLNDVNEGVVQSENILDLGDAYRLAVSNRGRQLSGKTLEQLTGKDSTRVSEDLKLLLSQLSAARGLELPITGMISPRVSGKLEDSRASDSLASIGMQMLHRRISLERNDSRNSLDRNESGFESLDLSIVSEIEGDNELDRLKRQVDHDKKLMSALCKELEEERNASAVAANQALAMITRVQEEKAALQMEALHDIRMMEEQAEYDVEALERANDLLAEKEKEIQDLEAERDYYRMKYPDDDLVLENEEDPTSDASHAEEATRPHYVNEKLHSSKNKELLSLGYKSSFLKNSWLGFEDEQLFISHQLSNLEKKLYLFSNSGIYPELGNGDYFKKEKPEQVGSQLKSAVEDNDILLQTNTSLSVGGGCSLVRRVHSFKTPKSIGQDSLFHTEADMVTLGDEVSTLNERLQALEADRKFLEHAINSLKNGEEGVHFIQEIASHLRELRRVGIKRKQSLA